LSLPNTQAASTQLLQVSLVILAIGFVTFVLYLYLLPNSQISEAEQRINQLIGQHATLTRQNAEIVREVSVYTDLGTIQQRGKALGMGPARNVIFLPEVTNKELMAQEAIPLPATYDPALASLKDESSTPTGWLNELKTRGAAMLNQFRAITQY
jgi:hypothetical protein